MDPYTAPAVLDGDDVPDIDDRLLECPRCGAAMELGFALTETTRFVSCSKLRRRFWFFGELLSQQSLLDRFLQVRSRYFCSHLCRGCGLFVVDTPRELAPEEAVSLAVRHDV